MEIMKRLTGTKSIVLILLILLIPQVIFAETILVLRSEGETFDQTYKAIYDDLHDEVTFIEKIIKRKTSTNDIEQSIRNIKPKIIILIGNKSVALYSSYQASVTDKNFPPGLALSALYIDKQLANVKNTSGIRYEIPAVTSAVQVRSLLNKPVRKIGVIYRQWMSDFIQINKDFCRQEDIELVTIKLENNPSFQEVKYHLKHLIKDDIDALWVVNDNILLSARLIQNAWIPALKNFNKPVIVGIDALTSTPLSFGTFSISPDNYALGVQGAEMIAEIIDNNWKIDQPDIVEPLSITKLLNVKLSKSKNIPINMQKLDAIDRLIQ